MTLDEGCFVSRGGAIVCGNNAPTLENAGLHLIAVIVLAAIAIAIWYVVFWVIDRKKKDL